MALRLLGSGAGWLLLLLLRRRRLCCLLLLLWWLRRCRTRRRPLQDGGARGLLLALRLPLDLWLRQGVCTARFLLLLLGLLGLGLLQRPVRHGRHARQQRPGHARRRRGLRRQGLLAARLPLQLLLLLRAGWGGLAWGGPPQPGEAVCQLGQNVVALCQHLHHVQVGCGGRRRGRGGGEYFELG